MSDTELEPRQARSRESHRRLLEATERLLEREYFERVTIQQIAAEAGLSVGAFYRRFADKEALLPWIYRRYNETFQAWFETWPDDDDRVLEERIVASCNRIHDFFMAHQGVIRTLHLHSRLDPGLADEVPLSGRESHYEALFDYWLAAPDAPPTRAMTRATREVRGLAITMMIAPIIEAALYPDLTPASIMRMGRRKMCQQLGRAITAYIEAQFSAFTTA